MSNEIHRKELTDMEWATIEALIPLLHKEKEWEISSFRGKKCLWEREEDQPFVPEEAVAALYKASKAVDLPTDSADFLTGIYREFCEKA
ncbi:MAG: hypothetical protein K5891_08410 [Lachnospiraceae bacterium]|nr:hypothetical protein [Lachnospiraceae bacterium]